jgi:hypothetical protein
MEEPKPIPELKTKLSQWLQMNSQLMRDKHSLVNCLYSVAVSALRADIAAYSKQDEVSPFQKSLVFLRSAR